MLNTKEYFKQIEMDTIQEEPLFVELTSEAADLVGGGAGLRSFGASVNFDTFLSTRSFIVRPGGGITLFSDTKSGRNNPSFSAAVRNVKTGNKTPSKSVRVGNDIFTTWTRLRGGTYKIDFRDTKDNIYVSGVIGVAYDS